MTEMFCGYRNNAVHRSAKLPIQDGHSIHRDNGVRGTSNVSRVWLDVHERLGALADLQTLRFKADTVTV